MNQRQSALLTTIFIGLTACATPEQTTKPTPVETAKPPKSTPVKTDQTIPVDEHTRRSLEIARLEAQIDREYKAFKERPRIRYVGQRSTDDRITRYVEKWRRQIERIGNQNYPDEARQKKLYGSLRLTVNIKADGTVEKIEIDRSSGSPILDHAAIRIVQMAAPYSPFPEDIRQDTDIIVLSRTWVFTNSDQLSSQ